MEILRTSLNPASHARLVPSVRRLLLSRAWRHAVNRAATLTGRQTDRTARHRIERPRWLEVHKGAHLEIVCVDQRNISGRA